MKQIRLLFAIVAITEFADFLFARFTDSRDWWMPVIVLVFDIICWVIFELVNRTSNLD